MTKAHYRPIIPDSDEFWDPMRDALTESLTEHLRELDWPVEREGVQNRVQDLVVNLMFCYVRLDWEHPLAEGARPVTDKNERERMEREVWESSK